MRPSLVLLAWVTLSVGIAAQSTPAPPDTEIFLAPLTVKDGRPAVGTPVNVSMNTGYDNQPSFTPDGQSILFTSVRSGAQTDIYRYDIGAGSISPVTTTAEGEYSPTVTPDGRHVSVIRVEADGTQRLWQFPLAGGTPTLVLERIKPVGYHAWLDDRTLALFVLGQPPTLQIADTRTGDARVVASDIGRSLHRVPGRATASFVQRPPAAGQAPAQRAAAVMEFDPAAGATTKLIDVVDGAGGADCAWTPDGWLLMARGSEVFAWKRGTAPAWVPIADLASSGARDITRLAVSSTGDRLALVAAGRTP